MVRFNGLCNCEIMVKKKDFFLDFVWKCFRKNLGARYISVKNYWSIKLVFWYMVSQC